MKKKLQCAVKLKKYEEENPGKYLIASQFGRNLAGADPSDLMSRNDYNEAFGENDWMFEELQSGRIPAELQKAMNKYTDRIQRQQADSNEKVNALLSRLDESKEPMDKA